MTKRDYTGLVSLYEELHDQGLEILAFPCNQFGHQESGTSEEIRAFVDKFGVKFPMFNKVEVNGKDAHPVFVFLKNNLSGLLGSSVKWNFTKFLCNREGLPVKRYGPPTAPDAIRDDIINLLR